MATTAQSQQNNPNQDNNTPQISTIKQLYAAIKEDLIDEENELHEFEKGVDNLTLSASYELQKYSTLEALSRSEIYNDIISPNSKILHELYDEQQTLENGLRQARRSYDKSKSETQYAMQSQIKDLVTSLLAHYVQFEEKTEMIQSIDLYKQTQQAQLLRLYLQPELEISSDPLLLEALGDIDHISSSSSSSSENQTKDNDHNINNASSPKNSSDTNNTPLTSSSSSSSTTTVTASATLPAKTMTTTASPATIHDPTIKQAKIQQKIDLYRMDTLEKRQTVHQQQVARITSLKETVNGLNQTKVQQEALLAEKQAKLAELKRQRELKQGGLSSLSLSNKISSQDSTQSSQNVNDLEKLEAICQYYTNQYRLHSLLSGLVIDLSQYNTSKITQIYISSINIPDSVYNKHVNSTNASNHRHQTPSARILLHHVKDGNKNENKNKFEPIIGAQLLIGAKDDVSSQIQTQITELCQTQDLAAFIHNIRNLIYHTL